MSKHTGDRKGRATSIGHDSGRPVGKGNPPRHTQFGQDRSGNAKGRPPGKKNVFTDIKETFEELLSIKQDGMKTDVSAQKAVTMRLRELALNGNIRAIELSLKQIAKASQNDSSEQRRMDPQELELLARRFAAKPPTRRESECSLDDDCNFVIEASWLDEDELLKIVELVKQCNAFERYREGEDNASDPTT